MRDPLYWVPLKYKLPVTVSFLYLLAFGIGGYLVTTDTRQALRALISEDLKNQTLLAKEILDARFEITRRRAEDFASDGFIRVGLETLLSGGDSETIGETREKLIDHLEANKLPLVPFFLNAALLDASGHLVLSARDHHPEIAASPDGLTSFSSILPVNSERDFRAFVVTTALKSLDGARSIGHLQMLIDLDLWLEGVDLGSTFGELPDECLRLHDPEGHSLDVRGHSSLAAIAPRSGDSTEPITIRHELPLRVAGWHLDLATPHKEAMRPITVLTARFIGIGASLLLVNLAFLFFPARFLLRPLLRLRRAAQEMTAGDESVRVPDTQSRDEIGDLSRAFNVMARAVEERSQRLKDSAQKLERQQSLVRFERDRLDVLVRSMQDGLFIMNDLGEVTFSNAAGHALVENLEAKSSAEREKLLCAHVDTQEAACINCLARRNALPSSCTIKIDNRIYEIHVTPLPTRSDQAKEGVYVSRDVTERLAQVQQQAHQERMHVVGELAAVVAHEMNNPLAAIVMFSQMMCEALQEESDLKKHADVILRNADACRRTISSLLEMSAFPAPEIGEFCVRDLLNEVSDFLRPLVERSSHHLEIVDAEDDLLLKGDEIQLRQVLVNLVMNAIQSGEGNDGKVILRANELSDSVVIEVEDDGPGIPPAIRDQIFEPFFSTKRPGMGTGLGLSTSRRITEAHGGKLSLKLSRPGKTIFSIEVPRNARVASSASTRQQESKATKGKHASSTS